MRFNKPYLCFLLIFLFALTACDLLSQLDKTPPTCIIYYPPDSAVVTGVVQIRAGAFDSMGVRSLEFYIDGGFFACESSAEATTYWDTRELPVHSWHQIFCVATDRAGNKGCSDTVNVQIFQPTQRNVFHGQITLLNQHFFWVDFNVESGEAILGDARALPDGSISKFSLLDYDNFQKYRSGKTYTQLYEKTNLGELTLNYQFTASGKYYLVFLNTTGKTQTYWARFVIQ